MTVHRPFVCALTTQAGAPALQQLEDKVKEILIVQCVGHKMLLQGRLRANTSVESQQNLKAGMLLHVLIQQRDQLRGGFLSLGGVQRCSPPLQKNA